MIPATNDSSTVPGGENVAPLESVLCTEELDRRPHRSPDYESENRALVGMAQALADSPDTILQKMAELMLEMFRADTAGVSLLDEDDGGKTFYWPAIAGEWKSHIGGGTPRDFGPCGDVLDCDAPLLFTHPEWRYHYLTATPLVEEALLVPFHVNGKAVGTIWLVAHNNRRKFDAEDRRQLVSMSRFASWAYQALAVRGKTVAMNEALLLGSLRQHGLTEAAEDLNARLKIEIAARERVTQELEEKVRLIDLSNDAIIVSDSDDKIRLWNKGAEKIFGWSFEEVIGKDLHSFLQTEFPKPLEEIIVQLHRDGHFNGEVVQIARDRRRVRLLCGWVLDRNTKSIFTSYTDITERHALEDALTVHAADLVLADRSKDEFLAMLAHELRNPLAPLRIAAEILRLPGSDEDERAQAQNILGRQIENMSRMIDDLLDISRITEGKIELRRESVELRPILDAAVDAVRPACADQNQHLTVSLPAEPVRLNADATRLEQVFSNLLGNACKYSGDGSHITLAVELGSAGEKQPREVIARVSDDGAGIDPDLLPHVFDLFKQASRTLDRAHGGLGIGLTLVKRLVKLHDGSVEARSEGLGHGSEFIVRLPLPFVSLPPPANSVAPVQEDPRRLLVVDDSKDSANVIAMLLRLRGHDTRTAFNGPDALLIAVEFLPDVILLDIGLPGMDGYEVARHLRDTPALAGTFLIAMTGYGSDDDRALALSAGFDRHLVKPLSPDRLWDCLRSRV